MSDNRSSAETGKGVAQQPQPGAPTTGASAASPAQDKSGQQPKVEYSLSGGLLARMTRQSFSLAFSSYQSGLLYMLGRKPDGGAHLHQSAQPKPMGLSFDAAGRLTMTGAFHIIRFENVLAPHERINHRFDACFVPRRVHFTGALDAHDIGIGSDGEPVFVNTRYNCLASTDPRHSFKPLWRPPFVSALVGEDRCHLNGLAIENNEPAFVTAVSRSDTIDGWRDRRADGGVVIDVRSGEIVCENLSMPHSPRLYRGELWLFNSGTGEFGVVADLASGKGSSSRAPFVRVSCAGCPSTATSPSLVCRSRATSASKAWR